MRFRGAVLLAGLLAGILVPGAAPARTADPSDPAADRRAVRVSAQAHPPVVTTGEPAVLAGTLSPAASGTEVVVQRRDPAGAWRDHEVTRTDARGRYDVRLATEAVGSADYRAVVGSARSGPVTLRVAGPEACVPATAPVDEQATPEAACLLTRLDRWRGARLMGVGQQLNVSNKSYLAPLEELRGAPVAVVGFDLEELAQGQTYQFPVPPLDGLLGLAAEGAVLSASWHADNPFTGPVRLDRLLDEGSAPGRRFWQDYDESLALLARFQDGDGGRFPPAAVVLRPLHEANGNWFWWGQPEPAVFHRLWARLQQRAWDAGVHNLVWAFSGNRRTSAAVDPGPLVPTARVDVGGFDTYDPERGRAHAKDRVWLEGYDRIRTRTPRIALTEVGPHGSTGAWRPSVITRTVRARALDPLWALLWFDDGFGSADPVRGDKQISSLRGGPAWLATCPNGLCATR